MQVFFKEGRHGILDEQTPTHKEQGAPASDMFLGTDHLAIWELRSLHLRLEKVPRTFLESQFRDRHLIAFSNEKHMSGYIRFLHSRMDGNNAEYILSQELTHAYPTRLNFLI